MSTSSEPAAAPDRALTVTDTPGTELDIQVHDPADYDWVPVLRKPRPDGWSPQRQRAFIGELADCGSVATAAQRVGMAVSGAYRLRRSPAGAAFAAAWDAAIQQSAHALIDAAFERAMNGSEEPVYDRDGRVIGRKHRQSDGLMMFLLRKHFPDRYGDLHRDRPALAVAPPPAPPPAPPVAETLTALDPPMPADPAALMTPDDAAAAFEVADMMDGELPRWHRQDGSDTEPDDAPLGARFEEAPESAKREADPLDPENAEENRAHFEACEEEERDRRRRRTP
jgi:hypothetical protein